MFADLKDFSYSNRPKVTTHEIHRLYKEGINTYSYYRDKLILEAGLDSYKIHLNDIQKHVSPFILSEEYDICLIPVGLNHPYHIALSESVSTVYEDLLNYSKCNNKIDLPCLIHYVDKPYFQNRYVKEMYYSWRKYNRYCDFTPRYYEKKEEILKVLKEVYPTEVNMLRFSSEILLECQDTFSYPSEYYNTNIISEFEESLK